jgi:hypothetical protein
MVKMTQKVKNEKSIIEENKKNLSGTSPPQIAPFLKGMQQDPAEIQPDECVS